MPRIPPGATDQRVHFLLRLKSNNQTATGILASSVTCYYHRAFSNPVQITPNTTVANNTSAHSDGGWKQVDATTMPGVYTLDVPDAAFATGASSVVFLLSGSTFYASPLQVTLSEDPLTSDEYDEIRDNVWQATLSSYGSGTAGEFVNAIPTAASNADAVWDEDRAAHTTSGTYGEGMNVQLIAGNEAAATNLSASARSITAATVDTGTFTATTTQLQSDTAGLSAVDDFYNDLKIYFYTGNLAGQFSDISDYDGTNKRFTYTAMTAAPDDNSLFTLI